MLDRRRKWQHSRQSCEATYRNAIEAQRDSEMSCPVDTAKPFPTDSRADGELVSESSRSYSHEVCDAYPCVGLAQKAGRPG
jgi:hypothetical protein